jgi:hypothetical protein
MIPDLITNLISDGLYPYEKYGSIICVAVIEHSTTPKTRGLALRECEMCVEKVGLNAIGKKGILAVAKSFSDETFTENKSLFLDLIETIILKLNGDVKKYMKLCGGAHLSSKARDAIEKRMSKKKKVQALKSSNQPSRTSLSSRSSRRSIAPPAPGTNSHAMKNDLSPRKETRHVERERRHADHDSANRRLNEESDGPFKFSYNSSGNKKVNNYNEESTGVTSNSESTQSHSQDRSLRREANSGAAASLRQRLRQIRDRHQPEQYEGATSPIPPSVQFSASSEFSPTPPTPNTLLYSIMEDVDDLLSQPLPLGRNTDKSSMALIGLRKLHASLSNSSTDSTGTDPHILNQLRQEVESKASFCVFKLARLVLFHISFLNLFHNS